MRGTRSRTTSRSSLPDLRERVSKWAENTDVFHVHRVDEQLAKGMDRKVWLPSGGSLVIDRTEAMTVVDVNTGKFTGAGGTLEETVTRNNLEAAEEIVRQLRLRDIGGIIVIDFIDMVLESNRDLVLRRLVECLGRDRTKHQVAEVTSLGLVQMTRKRVGQGLVEAFSETCEHCKGRGFIVHEEPIEKSGNGMGSGGAPASSEEGPRCRACAPQARQGRQGEGGPAAGAGRSGRQPARGAVRGARGRQGHARHDRRRGAACARDEGPSDDGPASLDEIQLPTGGSAAGAPSGSAATSTSASSRLRRTLRTHPTRLRGLAGGRRSGRRAMRRRGAPALGSRNRPKELATRSPEAEEGVLGAAAGPLT